MLVRSTYNQSKTATRLAAGRLLNSLQGESGLTGEIVQHYQQAGSAYDREGIQSMRKGVCG